jgi:hypothetical protein
LSPDAASASFSTILLSPPHEDPLAKLPIEHIAAPSREPADLPGSFVPTDRRLLANDRIKGLARRTFNKQVLSEIGGFAGLFALDAERYPDPVLVATTDGVGSKLQLAAQLGLHASISTTSPPATSTPTSSSRSSPAWSTPARPPAARCSAERPPRPPTCTAPATTNSPAS